MDKLTQSMAYAVHAFTTRHTHADVLTLRQCVQRDSAAVSTGLFSSSQISGIRPCSDQPLQVNGIPKYAAEDTTLSTVNAAGEKVIVPVPQGSDIGIHVAALHYNSERPCASDTPYR